MARNQIRDFDEAFLTPLRSLNVAAAHWDKCVVQAKDDVTKVVVKVEMPFFPIKRL